METRQLLKMLAGAVIFTLIVLGITMLLPGTSKADMDSDTRNPGLDKQESVIEQKISEFGTAMKGWAIAFGSDLKRSGESTKTAFLNDVERIKQSEFVQYQKKGVEQAKEQLARNKTQIAELFERLGGFIGNVGKNQK